MKTHVAIRKILKSINIHQDYHIWKKSICALCQPIRKGSAEWMKNGSVDKKNECGQKKLSVLSTTVGVECGVLSVTVPYLGNPPPKHLEI